MAIEQACRRARRRPSSLTAPSPPRYLLAAIGGDALWPWRILPMSPNAPASVTLATLAENSPSSMSPCYVEMGTPIAARTATGLRFDFADAGPVAAPRRAAVIDGSLPERLLMARGAVDGAIYASC